jgi:hypothetical protein
MKLVDMTRILLMVVGIGGLASDQTFSGEINQLFGHNAAGVVAALSATAAVASVVLHTVNNPTVPTPVPPVAPAYAPVEVAEVKPETTPTEASQYSLPTKG